MSVIGKLSRFIIVMAGSPSIECQRNLQQDMRRRPARQPSYPKPARCNRTMAWSSAERKLERSRGENAFGPLVISPALRSESIRLRVASVMPIDSSVKARPVGAIAAAPAFTERLASGRAAAITMSPPALRGRRSFGRPVGVSRNPLGDPVVGLVQAGGHHHALDQWIARHRDGTVP